MLIKKVICMSTNLSIAHVCSLVEQSPLQSTLLAYLYRLYCMEGFIELCYIDGNPKSNHLKRDNWYKIDPSKPETYHQAVNRLETLILKYGNVYVSKSQFSKRTRAQCFVIPSRIHFVDDPRIIPTLPFSMILETSEGNTQGCYITTLPVPANESESLSRSAAIALQADQSGWDSTQVIRVPCSFNTKNGRWAIPPHFDSGIVYEFDQLIQHYPALPFPTKITTDDYHKKFDTFDKKTYARTLPTYLDSDHVPWRCKNVPPWVRTCFINAVNGDYTHTQKNIPDASAYRYALIDALVMRGADDGFIFAYLEKYTIYSTNNKKNTSRNAHDNFVKDVVQITESLRQDYPNVKINRVDSNTSYVTKIDDTVALVTIKADELLAYFQRCQDDFGIIRTTRPELADELHCTLSSLITAERLLTKQDKIRRIQQGQHGSIVFIRDFEGVNQTLEGVNPALIHTLKPELVKPDSCRPDEQLTTKEQSGVALLRTHGGTQAQENGATSVPTGGVCPYSQGDPLLDAVLAIFDNLKILGVLRSPPLSSDELFVCVEQWLLSDQAIDYDTGQKYKNKNLRLCISHVRHMLGDTYSETSIQNAYKMARDEWQKYRNKLRIMTDEKLQTEYKNQLRLQTKHADDKLFKWHSVKVSIAAGEIQHRGLKIILAA